MPTSASPDTVSMVTDERVLRIGERLVGPGRPTYVIAEVSANHGQRIDHAVEIVRAAARSGADAVKLQTYTPDTITLDVETGPFVIGQDSPWAGRTLHDLYAEAMTPWEWHAEIFEAARREGLHFLSTPFDASAVEFLDGLGVPVYKIASFELVDIGLLRSVGATGKPVIMSTGMATAEEIEEAVDAAVGAGAAGVALLRCNSTYPASPDEMDLLTIPHMAEKFKRPIGLSDHTLTNTTAIAAVALGACIVEKHLTLDRGDGGPDAGFSLEPAEFAGLVSSIREAERVLGGVRYGPTAGELPSLALRRSLYVARDLRAGQVVSPDDVRSVRPGGGMHTRHLRDVVGRRARVDVERGTPAHAELFE